MLRSIGDTKQKKPSDRCLSKKAVERVNFSSSGSRFHTATKTENDQRSRVVLCTTESRLWDGCKEDWEEMLQHELQSESPHLCQGQSDPDSESVSAESGLGWLPKFNVDFLVQRYIRDNIFMKIRSVFPDI